jgi:hypothetical protein
MKMESKFDVGDYVWRRCNHPHSECATCQQILEIHWSKEGFTYMLVTSSVPYDWAKESELFTTKVEALR